MRSNGGDVAIVGCGINGMFTAYYLLREGYKVTIIDRSSEGLTSKNNAGLLTPSLSAAPELTYGDIARASTVGLGVVYISPNQILKNIPWFVKALRERRSNHAEVTVQFAKQSVDLYNKFFDDESINPDVVKGVGSFYESEEEALKFAKMLGGRFIDRSVLGRLGYKNLGGGVMFDKELSINSMKLFEGLRARIVGMGARLVFGNDARFKMEGGKVKFIDLGNGIVTADNYVAAAGSWSNELLEPTGYKPHIIPGRGLTLIFSTNGHRVIASPSLIEPAGIAIAQHNADTVRATSFFEFKGIDGRFSEKRKKFLTDILKDKLMRYDKMKLVYEGYGFRPCTPDQMPVLGKVPNVSNLFITGGQCRLGITLAPICGTIMADMIGKRKPKAKGLSYMRPERFSK